MYRVTYLELQLRIFICSLILKLLFCKEFEDLLHDLTFTLVYTVSIRSQQTFSVKEQMVNVLDSVGLKVSVATTPNSPSWCESSHRLCK